MNGLDVKSNESWRCCSIMRSMPLNLNLCTSCPVSHFLSFHSPKKSSPSPMNQTWGRTFINKIPLSFSGRVLEAAMINVTLFPTPSVGEKKHLDPASYSVGWGEMWDELNSPINTLSAAANCSKCILRNQLRTCNMQIKWADFSTNLFAKAITFYNVWPVDTEAAKKI